MGDFVGDYDTMDECLALPTTHDYMDILDTKTGQFNEYEHRPSVTWSTLVH